MRTILGVRRDKIDLKQDERIFMRATSVLRHFYKEILRNLSTKMRLLKRLNVIEPLKKFKDMKH